jgi:hypothetical protein
MSMSETHPGRLVELDAEECWQRIRSRTVGRLAWSGAHGISVIPVNFAVDDGAIVLRTSPYSLMARDCVDRDVAFEVDEIDEVGHTGWSVLLQGPCTRDRQASDAPRPWVTGPRTLGLRVEVRTVSGRRVTPPSAHA